MPKLMGMDFVSHLKQKQLSNVYFLYGTEKYMLKLNQKKLEKIVPTGMGGDFNISEFSTDTAVDDIADSALALPFMAESKLVVVKDFNIDSKNQTEISKLEELIKDPSESTVLVFTYPTLNIDIKKSAKWRNLLKLMEKHAMTVNFDTLTSQQLVSFVMRESEKGGSQISKYNADKIVQYVGTDMNSLKNEVHKLCSYANGNEISTDNIENLVVKNLETTVFILIKAIVKSDYATAYNLLNTLFIAGEEPVNILARISDTFVDLYRVRAALQSGKNALAPSKYGDYKGREFRLTNAERDLRVYSTEKLRECLEVLKESDLLLKSSKIQNKIVLEELIAKLLMVTKGESRK